MIESNWQYHNPALLWLLLLIPIFLIFKYKNIRSTSGSLSLPSISPFSDKGNFLELLSYTLPLFRAAFMALLIVALARPQIPIAETDLSNEKGVDVMLCVDVSISMLAKDFKPDRLSALKEISKVYIDETVSDRIGIVAYSDEAIMKIPLTMDKDMLKETINELNTNELLAGTDIGLGLQTAINHIKDSKAKSKVIILMSDGEHQPGQENNNPLLAAEIAKSKDIKIYTVGIGRPGIITMPVAYMDVFDQLHVTFAQGESNLDEELLQNIASIADGKYYRATSNESLKEIYEDIDKLEKTELGTPPKHVGYKELFQKYLIWALIILFFELFLRTFIYKSA